MLDIGVVFGMVGDDYNMRNLPPLLLNVVTIEIESLSFPTVTYDDGRCDSALVSMSLPHFGSIMPAMPLTVRPRTHNLFRRLHGVLKGNMPLTSFHHPTLSPPIQAASVAPMKRSTS